MAWTTSTANLHRLPQVFDKGQAQVGELAGVLVGSFPSATVVIATMALRHGPRGRAMTGAFECVSSDHLPFKRRPRL